MQKYDETRVFWDERFGKLLTEKKYYKAGSPLSLSVFEDGLKWISNGTDSVIDFGCGSGTVLFRCLSLGVKNAIGIDISPQAIALAGQTALENKMDNKIDFMIGSLDILSTIDSDSIKAGISSNLLDNIYPQDAELLIKEMYRILQKDGKFLVKLNDTMPKASFEDDYYQEISTNFYKEESGLYFWNLSNDAFKDLLTPYFDIVNYYDVPFPDTDYKNRLFYLKKV